VDVFNKAYHSQNEDLYSKFYIIKDKVEGFKTSFTTGSITATNLNNEVTDTLISLVETNKNTLASLTTSLGTTNTNLTSLSNNVTTNKTTLATLTTNLVTTNTNLTNLSTKVNTNDTSLTSQQTAIDAVIAKIGENNTALSVLEAFKNSLIDVINLILTPVNNIPFFDDIKFNY